MLKRENIKVKNKIYILRLLKEYMTFLEKISFELHEIKEEIKKNKSIIYYVSGFCSLMPGIPAVVGGIEIIAEKYNLRSEHSKSIDNIDSFEIIGAFTMLYLGAYLFKKADVTDLIKAGCTKKEAKAKSIFNIIWPF